MLKLRKRLLLRYINILLYYNKKKEKKENSIIKEADI